MGGTNTDLGLDLVKLLDKASQRLVANVEKAVETAGEEMLAETLRIVPVKTGRLKASLRKRKPKSAPGRPGVVMASKEVYAWVVNVKRKFMDLGFRKGQDKLVSILPQAVADALSQAAEEAQ